MCTFGRLIPHFSRQRPEKLPAAATVPHARPWASPLGGADSAQEGTLSSGDKQGAQSVFFSEATGGGVWRLSPEFPEKAQRIAHFVDNLTTQRFPRGSW